MYSGDDVIDVVKTIKEACLHKEIKIYKKRAKQQQIKLFNPFFIILLKLITIFVISRVVVIIVVSIVVFIIISILVVLIIFF